MRRSSCSVVSCRDDGVRARAGERPRAARGRAATGVEPRALESARGAPWRAVSRAVA
ncbi:hypothetical protein ACFPRL_15260 [Pseudoclavibacter helvolus]